MTPSEFLSVAVMLSTNFDERLAAQALECTRWARSARERSEWKRWHEEDMQRIDAKRVLWLEARC